MSNATTAANQTNVATAPSSISPGDTAWILMSTCLVMLMVPGLGYFYSGLARHKSALSLIFLSMISLAVVSVQWFLFGFSLAFSESSGPLVGDLNHALLIKMFERGDYTYTGVPALPGSAFMVYQGIIVAAALAIGAVAERTRIIPAIVFIFWWTTLVYDFIAYWSWAPNGWLHILGSLDFAGGSPVHIASGSAGLAYAIIAGKRHGFGLQEFKPHSLSSVFMGTALLWFGWFGFNGGSALGANARAAVAVVNTNLAAAMGGMTWVFLEVQYKKKFSAFAFCSGAVAGMVAITPGSGFVAPWSAIIIGFLGPVGCYYFVKHKHMYGFDDALDVFGVHGVGGILGNLLTGIFASKSIAALDGTAIPGGWLDGNFIQIVYQFVGSLVSAMWSFTLTIVILYAMDKLPHLNLRLAVAEELQGVDKAQMDETAYDYIEATVRGDSPMHEQPIMLLPATTQTSKEKDKDADTIGSKDSARYGSNLEMINIPQNS